jgi:hypothetical protein
MISTRWLMTTSGINTGYRVARHYFNRSSRRTIIDRCTLAEARAHCSNPEISSSTATSKTAKACTRRNGPWFDGYEER